ncbi:Glycylpeptide N-tetradecanoyltransferase 1 [Sarcoptes scabiei]|uniref:Glycylpeptide N-tetradecanoyltransferase n=1 Tax=Sarcoptes scabiei TaxID=52283 RepID=A0A834VFM5_SARSC|nr:Glycylpeptide N-tetradecanoyltransferase 1 [Sarcoptes scabiei]
MNVPLDDTIATSNPNKDANNIKVSNEESESKKIGGEFETEPNDLKNLVNGEIKTSQKSRSKIKNNIETKMADDEQQPSTSANKNLQGTQMQNMRKVEEIRRTLDLLKLKTATLGTNNEQQPKSREDAMRKKFEFWTTQPVPKLTENDPVDGQNEPIHPPMDPNQISQQSLTLPDSFCWVVLNIDNEDELNELYTLLYENYVEDDDNMFRFNYSPEFLRWVLKAPGWHPEWFLGVRVQKQDKKGKLVGFISAIPSKIRVYDKILETVEINFLCVHKKLRSKRMAPVLISEITRRVRLRGIFQALYTAGVFLPKPIASCRYYHRSLNPKKLVDVGFSHLTRNMTISRMNKLLKLPDKPLLSGLRRLERKDIKQVHALLTEHMKQFDLVPLFNLEETEHWLLPKPDVIDSYVVERINDGTKKKEIIGFFSFYILPSTVMNNKQYKEVRAAYSFYNVSTDECSLVDLMTDALIIAKNSNLDVFNALNQRDNGEFLEKLKFGCGDGDLHFYLFNWKCPPMKSAKVGVVLQ